MYEFLIAAAAAIASSATLTLAVIIREFLASQYRRIEPTRAALDDQLAAAAYAAMPHTPLDGEVILSYESFTTTVIRQWHAIERGGHVHIDFHTGDHEYASSAAMHADVMGGHLWTRLSDSDGLPKDHPMARGTGIYRNGRELCVNDVFRAVHDLYGHHGVRPRLLKGGVVPDMKAPRHSFGANGERNAWRRHRETFSPKAWLALWCETRGQAASYVVTKSFAEQKAGSVPRALI